MKLYKLAKESLWLLLPVNSMSCPVLIIFLGNKTLCELRQLYFKMKTSVFGSDRAGVAYDTVALEELLREELGESTRMGSIKFPRCY